MGTGRAAHEGAAGGLAADVALQLRPGKAQVHHSVEGRAEFVEQFVQGQGLGGGERVVSEEKARSGRPAQAVADDRCPEFVRERPAGVQDLPGPHAQPGALMKVVPYEVTEGDPWHCQASGQRGTRCLPRPRRWFQDDDTHRLPVPRFHRNPGSTDRPTP